MPFRAIACCWLVMVGATTAAPVSGEHPLLDLARERESDRETDDYGGYYARQLARLEHELSQAAPPPDPECGQSMGAGRFSAMHLELADARHARGDLDGAIASYRSALACRPRSSRILGQLASVLFGARQYDAARAAIDQALDIDPRNVSLHRVAGNLDFVAGRWADAAARFRYVAVSESEPGEAASGQLMFWLAQRRAGVTRPEFIVRRVSEYWPNQLILYSKGEYSEAELAQYIRGEDDEDEYRGSDDQRLSAALYYVGESYLARGDADVARRYFAAAVNIRLTWSDEYRLALAEIARLNGR